jgi:hypothetical protein
VTLTPDAKDWTWVLRKQCPECGLDVSTVDRSAIPGMIRSNAWAWERVLSAAEDVRRRPDSQTWSPLEYACHVRDVFLIFDRRLGLMLTEDDPLFPNWDQDATAVADRYAEQDPDTVASHLVAAALAISTHFEELFDAQWRRPGRRSDGATFTVESFARYLLHDPVHHLYDVTGQGHQQ